MTRILYLHGFASGPSSSKGRFFRQILEHAGATVLVPDLAQGDFEHLTITGQLAVIDEIVGGAPAALVGSSMGGYLAALYAAHHAAITRLVLLAPAFGFALRWPEWLGAEAIEAWRRNGWMEVFHYGGNRQRRLSYALLEDAARYEDYPDFSQPALIFHGLHDDVVPVDSSRQFAAGHRNARLEIMDSGHELLNVLEEIGPQVSGFLLPPSPTRAESAASSPRLKD
jgi:pimeloyl-ACP methyl ester carboxylesterase